MRFVFNCKWDYDTSPKTEITYETDAVSLQEIVSEFEMFLKGCGFEFKELDIDYE